MFVIAEAALQQVASTTGGQYYRAQNANQLQRALAALPRYITVTHKSVDIADVFAGAGDVMSPPRSVCPCGGIGSAVCRPPEPVAPALPVRLPDEAYPEREIEVGPCSVSGHDLGGIATDRQGEAASIA